MEEFVTQPQASPTGLRARLGKRAGPHILRAWASARRNARLLDKLSAAARDEARRVASLARDMIDQAGSVRGVVEAAVVGDADVVATAEEAWDHARTSLLAAQMEAELMEAYDVFQFHEHRITAWKAQAVLVMKLLEHEAMTTLRSLPAARREQLRATAREMRDASLATGERTRGDAQCGQCVRKLAPDLRGGDCCSGMVFLGWDQVDALFRVLLGERAPVIHEFKGDPTRCGFVGERGCVLTAGARPTVCTAYYCESYRADLQKDGRWEALANDLLALSEGRRQVNFQVNMARRFAKDTTVEERAHPLDFVWERLRQSGAEISATGQRQRSRGKLPVLN